MLSIYIPFYGEPHYLKKGGLENGVYVRLGSSNRLADKETIAALQRNAKHISFDEMACTKANMKDLDQDLINGKKFLMLNSQK